MTGEFSFWFLFAQGKAWISLIFLISKYIYNKYIYKSPLNIFCFLQYSELGSWQKRRIIIKPSAAIGFLCIILEVRRLLEVCALPRVKNDACLSSRFLLYVPFTSWACEYVTINLNSGVLPFAQKYWWGSFVLPKILEICLLYSLNRAYTLLCFSLLTQSEAREGHEGVG